MYMYFGLRHILLRNCRVGFHSSECLGRGYCCFFSIGLFVIFKDNGGRFSNFTLILRLQLRY